MSQLKRDPYKRPTAKMFADGFDRRKTKRGAHHFKGRAGSKLLKRFIRAKYDTVTRATLKTYAGLQEPKYRQGESKKRIAKMEEAEGANA